MTQTGLMGLPIQSDAAACGRSSRIMGCTWQQLQ